MSMPAPATLPEEALIAAIGVHREPATICPPLGVRAVQEGRVEQWFEGGSSLVGEFSFPLKDHRRFQIDWLADAVVFDACVAVQKVHAQGIFTMVDFRQ